MFPFGSFDGRLEPIPINKSRIKVESSPGFNFGVWHQKGSRTRARGPLNNWTTNGWSHVYPARGRGRPCGRCDGCGKVLMIITAVQPVDLKIRSLEGIV